MIADPFAALRFFLLTRPEIVALVDDRVHVVELPPALTAVMPQTAIVLVPAGGPPALGPMGQVRVDLFCYAGSPQAADAIRRTVVPALDALQQKVAAGVLLHGATPAGGPLPLRDPDGRWPVSWQSWTLHYGERAAA